MAKQKTTASDVFEDISTGTMQTELCKRKAILDVLIDKANKLRLEIRKQCIEQGKESLIEDKVKKGIADLLTPDDPQWLREDFARYCTANEIISLAKSSGHLQLSQRAIR